MGRRTWCLATNFLGKGTSDGHVVVGGREGDSVLAYIAPMPKDPGEGFVGKGRN